MDDILKAKYIEQGHALSGLSKLILRDRDDHGGRTFTEGQLEIISEELLKASRSIKILIGEEK